MARNRGVDPHWQRHRCELTPNDAEVFYMPPIGWFLACKVDGTATTVAQWLNYCPWCGLQLHGEGSADGMAD